MGRSLRIDTSCGDWERRLKRGELPINPRGLPIRTAAARRFSSIYGRLTVPDMQGHPLAGDLPTQGWLDTIARALFGSRTIKEAFVLVPKKQAKTSGFALMMLSAFLLNRVHHQRFSLIAPTVAIATFAFDQIVGSIEADPELATRTRIRSHVREIDHLGNGSMIAVKPSSLASVTGLKGYVFVDELHLWGAMRDGQKLRQQLRGALVANPDAKGAYITTQSDDEPAGVFRAMLSYARSVRDGRIVDPAFLPVLFEPWKGCDPWTDESVWPKLLPSYPHIADRRFYQAAIVEANQSGPAAIAEAKSQFFNIEIGRGEGAEGWAIAPMVPKLMQPLILDELLDASSRVSIGIDLGGAWDMSALVVLGVDEEDRWRVWSRAWLTKGGLARNVLNAARLQGFVDAGDLEIITPGGDIGAMLGICERARETGKLGGIGVDPAGAADLADALEGAGFVMDQDLFGIGQTAFKLAPAVRSLERRVDRKAIIFADQPLMTWSIGNIAVEMRGNAPSVSKERGLDKVDVVFALLDAITVEIVHGGEALDALAMIA